MLISASDWASIEETLYLLASPKNADRLLAAVRGFEAARQTYLILSKIAAKKRICCKRICRVDSAATLRYHDKMNVALDVLRRERDEAAEQIRMLRTRIKDLDAALALLEGQPTTTKSSRSGGDLKAIVLRKLQEFSSDGGSPKEIADALTSDGRPTSDASVSSTLSRLKGESKVINRSGQWFAVNLSTDSYEPDFKSPSSGHPGEWDELEDVPF